LVFLAGLGWSLPDGGLVEGGLVEGGLPRAEAHDKKDEALPPPPVRMRIIAPSAQGPWLLRIDNESDAKVRIPADVRLLTFQVRAPSTRSGRRSYANGWARRATTCDGPGAFGLTDHFPVRRELVLEPGHSYTEEFDPRLICFGKDAELLVPGAKVKPYLGWKPKPRWSKRMASAPFAADAASVPRKYRPLRRLEAPTIVLSHDPPVTYGPKGEGPAPPQQSDPKEAKPPKEASPKDKGAKGDEPGGAPGPPSQPPDSGMPDRLPPPGAEGAGRADQGGRQRRQGHGRKGHHHGDEGSPKAESAEQASMHRPRRKRRRLNPVTPPPPQDDLGAKMTLTATHYADARRPTGVQLSVQAHNVGERPLFVALRSRMLSFRVLGPNGMVLCRRQSVDHEVPRDLFRTLHHGKHVHMDVLLAELCPPGTFDRPGLYYAIPTLHADADGRQYGLSAVTGIVTTRDPGDPGGTHRIDDDATLIRITRGRLPFYRGRAKELPTRVLPK
jgi:hypothetical protein